ncbi:unnamed protein product [Closterium sp. NIES-64]|nr:unnamed protein product [Closterium sp. NIES-64]
MALGLARHMDSPAPLCRPVPHLPAVGLSSGDASSYPLPGSACCCYSPRTNVALQLCGGGAGRCLTVRCGAGRRLTVRCGAGRRLTVRCGAGRRQGASHQAPHGHVCLFHRNSVMDTLPHGSIRLAATRCPPLRLPVSQDHIPCEGGRWKLRARARSAASCAIGASDSRRRAGGWWKLAARGRSAWSWEAYCAVGSGMQGRGDECALGARGRDAWNRRGDAEAEGGGEGAVCAGRGCESLGDSAQVEASGSADELAAATGGAGGEDANEEGEEAPASADAAGETAAAAERSLTACAALTAAWVAGVPRQVWAAHWEGRMSDGGRGPRICTPWAPPPAAVEAAGRTRASGPRLAGAPA